MTTEQDITIEQGATFSLPLSVDASHDGATASAALRAGFGASGTLLGTFTATAISGGALSISLSAAATAALPVPAGARADERRVLIGYYDVQAASGGVVTRLYQGRVYLSRRVTS